MRTFLRALPVRRESRAPPPGEWHVLVIFLPPHALLAGCGAICGFLLQQRGGAVGRRKSWDQTSCIGAALRR